MMQGAGLPKNFQPAFKPGLGDFINQFQKDGGQFMPQPPNNAQAFSINPDQKKFFTMDYNKASSFAFAGNDQQFKQFKGSPNISNVAQFTHANLQNKSMFNQQFVVVANAS